MPVNEKIITYIDFLFLLTTTDFDWQVMTGDDWEWSMTDDWLLLTGDWWLGRWADRADV